MGDGDTYDICTHCGGDADEVGPIKERHIGDTAYIVCDSCKSSIRSRRPNW